MKRGGRLRQKAKQPKKKRIALPGERQLPPPRAKQPKSQRSSGLRRTTHKPRNPEEVAKLEREMAAFKEAARRQGVCAVCGRGGGGQCPDPETGRREAGDFHPWEAHHVLSRSFLKRYGYPQWHPDNALRLHYEPAHGQHTRGSKRIDLTVLRDENIDYIVRLLGEDGAFNYLTRNYSGSDPRVDRLLSE